MPLTFASKAICKSGGAALIILNLHDLARDPVRESILVQHGINKLDG